MISMSPPYPPVATAWEVTLTSKSAYGDRLVKSATFYKGLRLRTRRIKIQNARFENKASERYQEFADFSARDAGTEF